MTPEQVKLVQDSFAKVVPIADAAADLFYDRLFTIAPEVRTLFPKDMTEQKKKFMHMIAAAATNLHQLEKIIPAVEDLGRRHVTYGVTDSHYERVGEALLWTLEQKLGPSFTPKVREAWTATYATVADVMKNAAAAAWTQMSALIRAYDWSATPLGPMQSWPQSLKTAVDLLLANRFAIALAWGPELTLIYNDAYRPLLGTRPEALGRPFLEVWAEVRETLTPMVESALAGKSTYFENRPFSLTRYGYPEETYFTFCLSPVRDERGANAGVLITAVETTKQVAANRAREVRLAHLAAVVEQSRDFIGVCNPEGTPLYVNEAGLRLMGLGGLDAACAVHFTEYFAERDRAFVCDEAMPTCERDGFWEGELTFRRFDDGRELPVLVNIFPVRTAEGRTIAYATLTRDLTEKKRVEQTLRKTRSELARIARQTTMGEMTASIAHDIKQPLAAIVTNGNAVLRWLASATPDLDEVRAALKRIINDGHRASQVIASIRAMFGKGAQERARVDVNDVVNEVLALMQAELHGQHVSVQSELLDELPQVLAHRVQLQQVILNLITNAAEAMHAITDRARMLRVTSQKQDDGSVLVAVADSGTGIDPDDMDRIFDAFFTTKDNGMGMGLSICRSIVKAHGGRLWASAGVPHGSIFHVVLPTDGGASPMMDQADGSVLKAGRPATDTGLETSPIP
jgi:PAS domain S-box-containing protein